MKRQQRKSTWLAIICKFRYCLHEYNVVVFTMIPTFKKNICSMHNQRSRPFNFAEITIWNPIRNIEAVSVVSALTQARRWIFFQDALILKFHNRPFISQGVSNQNNSWICDKICSSWLRNSDTVTNVNQKESNQEVVEYIHSALIKTHLRMWHDFKDTFVNCVFA